eukprot:g5336.t1
MAIPSPAKSDATNVSAVDSLDAYLSTQFARGDDGVDPPPSPAIESMLERYLAPRGPSLSPSLSRTAIASSHPLSHPQITPEKAAAYERLKAERDSILRNSNAGLNLGDMEEEEEEEEGEEFLGDASWLENSMRDAESSFSRREALLGSVYGPLDEDEDDESTSSSEDSDGESSSDNNGGLTMKKMKPASSAALERLYKEFRSGLRLSGVRHSSELSAENPAVAEHADTVDKANNTEEAKPAVEAEPLKDVEHADTVDKANNTEEAELAVEAEPLKDVEHVDTVDKAKSMEEAKPTVEAEQLKDVQHAETEDKAKNTEEAKASNEAEQVAAKQVERADKAGAANEVQGADKVENARNTATTIMGSDVMQHSPLRRPRTRKMDKQEDELGLPAEDASPAVPIAMLPQTKVEDSPATRDGAEYPVAAAEPIQINDKPTLSCMPMPAGSSGGSMQTMSPYPTAKVRANTLERRTATPDEYAAMQQKMQSRLLATSQSQEIQMMEAKLADMAKRLQRAVEPPVPSTEGMTKAHIKALRGVFTQLEQDKDGTVSLRAFIAALWHDPDGSAVLSVCVGLNDTGDFMRVEDVLRSLSSDAECRSTWGDLLLKLQVDESLQEELSEELKLSEKCSENEGEQPSWFQMMDSALVPSPQKPHVEKTPPVTFAMLESPREIQKSDEVSRGYEEPVLHAAPPSEEEWRDEEEEEEEEEEEWRDEEKDKEKERNGEQQKGDEAAPPRADKVTPVHTVRGKFQPREPPRSLGRRRKDTKSASATRNAPMTISSILRDPERSYSRSSRPKSAVQMKRGQWSFPSSSKRSSGSHKVVTESPSAAEFGRVRENFLFQESSPVQSPGFQRLGSPPITHSAKHSPTSIASKSGFHIDSQSGIPLLVPFTASKFFDPDVRLSPSKEEESGSGRVELYRKTTAKRAGSRSREGRRRPTPSDDETPVVSPQLSNETFYVQQRRSIEHWKRKFDEAQEIVRSQNALLLRAKKETEKLQSELAHARQGEADAQANSRRCLQLLQGVIAQAKRKGISLSLNAGSAGGEGGNGGGTSTSTAITSSPPPSRAIRSTPSPSSPPTASVSANDLSPPESSTGSPGAHRSPSMKTSPSPRATRRRVTATSEAIEGAVLRARSAVTKMRKNSIVWKDPPPPIPTGMGSPRRELTGARAGIKAAASSSSARKAYKYGKMKKKSITNNGTSSPIENVDDGSDTELPSPLYDVHAGKSKKAASLPESVKNSLALLQKEVRKQKETEAMLESSARQRRVEKRKEERLHRTAKEEQIAQNRSEKQKAARDAERQKILAKGIQIKSTRSFPPGIAQAAPGKSSSVALPPGLAQEPSPTVPPGKQSAPTENVGNDTRTALPPGLSKSSKMLDNAPV